MPSAHCHSHIRTVNNITMRTQTERQGPQDDENEK